MKEFNIEVKPYLTYAQIQNICDAVCKFDSWAEREQNVDILMLHYVTNMTDEEIEERGHEALLMEGTIDFVKSQIKNFDRIYEAVNYTQSIQRQLSQIVAELPTALEPVKKAMKRGKKSSK